MSSVQPVFDQFRSRYEAGTPQLVWRRLIADLETPVSAMLKVADSRPYSFLFESVIKGDQRGRYSFIGLMPDLIWRARGERAEINRRARTDLDSFEPCAEPTLASLRALEKESRIDIPPALPPMAAGLFGYLGYDTVRLIERIPDTNPDQLGIPDAVLMRPTVVLVFDTVLDTVTLVTPIRPQAGIDAAAAYDLATERLMEIATQFGRGLPHRRESLPLGHVPEAPTPNMSREDFHAMVERAKEYIFAGDIFQVVPSQRFTLPFPLPSFSLYRSLRRLNPSPFLFHVDVGGFQLVGSSPEILVRLRDGTVTIRPLAGTRKRGADAAEDAALKADLLADPKELAEHLMLLDLGRNDVGRVATIGSVEVTEINAVENYSHVMHIVSNVEGKLRPDLDAFDALMAGFPAGTVSGAPKVRAMEIIDTLEPVRRGVYAGAVGYFGAGGAMDTCIALRTGVVKDGTLYVQAGGGIVADSDPEAEYQESCNKAQALIRAAEEAFRVAAEE